MAPLTIIVEVLGELWKVDLITGQAWTLDDPDERVYKTDFQWVERGLRHNEWPAVLEARAAANAKWQELAKAATK